MRTLASQGQVQRVSPGARHQDGCVYSREPGKERPGREPGRWAGQQAGTGSTAGAAAADAAAAASAAAIISAMANCLAKGMPYTFVTCWLRKCVLRCRNCDTDVSPNAITHTHTHSQQAHILSTYISKPYAEHDTRERTQTHTTSALAHERTNTSTRYCSRAQKNFSQ